jgi:hypothetical protein
MAEFRMAEFRMAEFRMPSGRALDGRKPSCAATAQFIWPAAAPVHPRAPAAALCRPVWLFRQKTTQIPPPPLKSG